VPYRLGHFFLAIDVEAFCPLEDFQRTTGTILRELRASKKAPGQDRIYTAGEKEWLAWLDRRDRGVPINPALRRDMDIMRRELGLTSYIFPWD
jgi:LDH2 family malate/lactate/ureidoglycolate dehydrogenase